MVPTVAFPPVIPSTAQVTEWLVVFATTAVNCCDCVNVTGAREGWTVTVTAAKAFSETRTNSVQRKRPDFMIVVPASLEYGNLAQGCSLCIRIQSQKSP